MNELKLQEGWITLRHDGVEFRPYNEQTEMTIQPDEIPKVIAFLQAGYALTQI